MSLTVITGPMFSGKSTELIRQIRRAQIAEAQMQLFKYAQDARYADAQELASYDGHTITAVTALNTHEVIKKMRPEAHFVVFDEIQFFDDINIDYVCHLVEEGRRVMCAGLNLDFRGEPFPFVGGGRRTMADLLVRADFIVKLSGVCTDRDGRGIRCGAEATRTQRLVDENPANYHDPIKMIGSQESYEARCVKHHAVPGRVCSLEIKNT